MEEHASDLGIFLYIYRKSLKETRGSYSFFDASNASLIQGRVLFITQKTIKFIVPPLVEVKPLLSIIMSV